MTASVAAAVAAGTGGCCLLLVLLLRRHLRRRRRQELQQPAPSLSELADAGIVVTGAGGGIGAALTRRLVANVEGALIVAGCRRRQPTVSAASSSSSVLRILPVDLASLASVRQFADSLADIFGPGRGRRLSHLVCNAGVFFPTPADASADGLPTHAAVNFIANVALTHWLLGNGVLVPGFTRVLLVSSSLSRRGVARPACEIGEVTAAATSAAVGYADSKQCLNLLAQRLHAGRGLHACAAFTGGPVATELLLHPAVPRLLRPLALRLMALAFQPPELVAERLLELMCRPGMASGRVYSAGQVPPCDWPVELPPEKLALFIDSYERLVDSLLPPLPATAADGGSDVDDQDGGGEAAVGSA